MNISVRFAENDSLEDFLAEARKCWNQRFMCRELQGSLIKAKISDDNYWVGVVDEATAEGGDIVQLAGKFYNITKGSTSLEIAPKLHNIAILIREELHDMYS